MAKKTYEDIMEKLRSVPGSEESMAEFKQDVDDLTEQFLEQGFDYKSSVWYATSLVMSDQYERGEKYVLKEVESSERN